MGGGSNSGFEDVVFVFFGGGGRAGGCWAECDWKISQALPILIMKLNHWIDWKSMVHVV